jgi:hypothetical protein
LTHRYCASGSGGGGGQHMLTRQYCEGGGIVGCGSGGSGGSGGGGGGGGGGGVSSPSVVVPIHLACSSRSLVMYHLACS